jgi:hypothetical protein
MNTTASPWAPTPPRGWNSYNSYTWKISEAQFLANCRAVATQLLPFGYDTCVVDYLWFQDLDGAPADAAAVASRSRVRDPITRLHIDGYGRLQPSPDRWPSAWSAAGEPLGFKAVAEEVHAMGLKFGIHIMRGISRAAVDARAPVLGGGGATAADIGVPARLCPWWQGVMDVNLSHPAGQRFYDSIWEQYAAWGVDYVKNDCVFGAQFLPDAIAAQSASLLRTRRPMVYSLSPGGGANVTIARAIARDVNLYRITGDDWDNWGDLSAHFAAAASFAAAGLIGAAGLRGSSWPDLDMLPLGVLTTPNSGRQPYRNCSLTRAEQRTQMTLWGIARSPLMFGGSMISPSLDAATRSLLTNRKLLALNSNSSGNAQVRPALAASRGVRDAQGTGSVAAAAPLPDQIVWTAHGGEYQYYAALFNLSPSRQSMLVSFGELGLPKTLSHCDVWDLWEHPKVPAFGNGSVGAEVDAHGVALFGLDRCA